MAETKVKSQVNGEMSEVNEWGENVEERFLAKYCNLINNPSFSKKLAEHSKPVYRESWFNENPFKYQKGEN